MNNNEHKEYITDVYEKGNITDNQKYTIVLEILSNIKSQQI